MSKKKDPMEWEVIESEYLFRKPWLTARRDHVKLPTGAEIKDFYVLEYPEFKILSFISLDSVSIQSFFLWIRFQSKVFSLDSNHF